MKYIANESRGYNKRKRKDSPILRNMPQYTFEEMESQNFSYKIQLFPNTTTAVTSGSRAYVLYVNDVETEGDCRDGNQLHTKI